MSEWKRGGPNRHVEIEWPPRAGSHEDDDPAPFKAVIAIQRAPDAVPEGKAETVYQWGWARRVMNVRYGQRYTQIHWVGDPHETRHYPSQDDWEARRISPPLPQLPRA